MTGGFWKSVGILPVIALLILVPILSERETSITMESPLLLAFLNTIFLGGIPLAVAYMAAKSHRATGDFGFLVVGCGLMFFGVSSLFAGWVMPLEGDPNLNVTLHNLGSLFAGGCQLVGRIFSFTQLLAHNRQGFALCVTSSSMRESWRWCL